MSAMYNVIPMRKSLGHESDELSDLDDEDQIIITEMMAKPPRIDQNDSWATLTAFHFVLSGSIIKTLNAA